MYLRDINLTNLNSELFNSMNDNDVDEQDDILNVYFNFDVSDETLKSFNERNIIPSTLND